MSSLEEVGSGKDFLEEAYFSQGTWSSRGSPRRPSPRVSCRPAGTQTHRPCCCWPGVGTEAHRFHAKRASGDSGVDAGPARAGQRAALRRGLAGRPPRHVPAWSPLTFGNRCALPDSPGLGCAAALSEAFSPRKHTLLWPPTVGANSPQLSPQ